MKLEFSNETIAEIKDAFSTPAFQRLKDSLLAIMLGQKDELFEKSQSPNGTSWAPPSPATLKRKEAKAAKTSKKKRNSTWSSPRILVDTGALQNSMSIKGDPNSFQSTEGSEVTLGTNLEYAAAQNFGYKAIPARPFIGIGDHDNEEIQEKIVAFIGKESA